MRKPLAERIRPSNIEDVVGQKHLLGEGKILKRMLLSGMITNMIFYGPPGTGKTTVANIIANETNKRFYKLNATNASVKDIKNIINDLQGIEGSRGVLLYLDEIQNFNKKQQQSLLEFVENGMITLIASTTENPYHYVYKALLSRSNVFEFKLLDKTDIKKGLARALEIIKEDLSNFKVILDSDAFDMIAAIGGGDLRRALNILELAVYTTHPDEQGKIKINVDIIELCAQNKILNYDKFGDSHYDILSAFQKSIRGSDPDASVHYLARLVMAGDIISICRRLMVIASEDIGMAYPMASVIVKSCVDSAMQLGLPEARIPLAHATLVLATAPKSNSAITAVDNALSDLETKDVGDIPLHLKDAHYDGAQALGRGKDYLYPHDFNNNYVKQQYLPDNIRKVKYYIPGDNKFENRAAGFLSKLKEE
ncbi:MAG: replication-associated recombination protein A [Clostridia bacterium]|nr:replication-associated recombination protein A [Clostridia bacterium]